MADCGSGAYVEYRDTKLWPYAVAAKRGWLRGPVSLQIGLTHACANRCVMCQHWQRGAGAAPYWAPVDRLLEVLGEFAQMGGESVCYSGGEPLMQAAFVRELFAECKGKGLHTCLEASGYCQWESLAQVLEHTDLMYYDLKHMDSQLHHQYTGQSNKLILDNARLVVASGVPFLFRIPLIPEINDTQSNVKATVAFVKSLGGDAARVELLPYHRLGFSKYEALSRDYALKDVIPPPLTHADTVKAVYEKLGVVCTVSR